MHFLAFFHHEIELRRGAAFKGVIDFPKVFLSIEIPAVGPTHQDDRCKNDDPQDNPSHRFHPGFGVNNTRGPTVSTRANGLDGVALSGDLIGSASVREPLDSRVGPRASGHAADRVRGHRFHGFPKGEQHLSRNRLTFSHSADPKATF
jgi:hypothetical protein